MPTVHKGFTLVEVVIVIAILGILSAVAIPSYSKLQEQSSAKICAANRSSLEMKLESKVALSNASSLEQAFNAKSASYAKDYQCPSGGKYSVEDNNAVTCDVHKPDPSAILRKQMNIIAEDKNAAADSNWRKSIKAMLDSGIEAFESVNNNPILDKYNAMSNKTTSIPTNLTWKPAKFGDRWLMIASTDELDQQAIKNVNNYGGGYNQFAYLIFDGKHYYGHFKNDGVTIDSNWVSDNGHNQNTKIITDLQKTGLCDLGTNGIWRIIQ